MMNPLKEAATYSPIKKGVHRDDEPLEGGGDLLSHINMQYHRRGQV